MTEENLKPIKWLVVSMSLVLMGGGLLVSWAVWKEMSAGKLLESCPGGVLDLKGRGVVTGSTIENQTLRLMLRKHKGHGEVVTVNLCSGKVIGSLSMETDAGAE